MGNASQDKTAYAFGREAFKKAHRAFARRWLNGPQSAEKTFWPSKKGLSSLTMGQDTSGSSSSQ